MNFRKTSERGGGHFRSEKIRCGFFGNFGGVKTMNFRKKGGVTPIRMNFVANFRASQKKRNIVFQNEGGGGGPEAVWKFSENSSKMVHTVVPKRAFFLLTSQIQIQKSQGSRLVVHLRAGFLAKVLIWKKSRMQE